MIPHSRPLFDGESVAAVGRVVQGGHTARGPRSEALEARVAELTAMPHAVAVDSGTSALMLALFSLSQEAPMHRIGIPAYACRAVLHAVRAAGCEPVFMDCADDLRLHREQALEIAPTLDAVIVVHPFGMIEPMISEDWPCAVIEDIAQGAGGQIDGKPLGGFGDIAIASFYANKPWGGAYGGMLLSKQTRHAERVRVMRHADMADVSLPYAGNHQLSDVHAALADTRLDRAAAEQRQRQALAERYDAWLGGKSGTVVRRDANANHYRYIVRVQDAEQTIGKLHACGVGAALPVDVPLSRLLEQSCPGAERARRECVSLPLLADMSRVEEDIMQQAINTCL